MIHAFLFYAVASCVSAQLVIALFAGRLFPSEALGRRERLALVQRGSFWAGILLVAVTLYILSTHQVILGFGYGLLWLLFSLMAWALLLTCATEAVRFDLPGHVYKCRRKKRKISLTGWIYIVQSGITLWMVILIFLPYSLQPVVSANELLLLTAALVIWAPLVLVKFMFGWKFSARNVTQALSICIVVSVALLLRALIMIVF